jgi:phosphatidylglycerol lysyltransferase
MRRVPDAPPGVIELLLVRAIERFQAAGARRVSLGMVAMADTRQEMTPMQQQIASFASGRLRLLERHQTLLSFKQKFHPHWESRYIVFNSTLAFPKIALAVLRLRNYSGGGLVKLIK